MKNIVSKLLLLTIGAFCFYQCAEDEDIFVANTDVQPALLDVNVPESLVLDPQFSSNTIINFSWQAADYGQPTEITYSVEVDDSAEFTEPVTVTSTRQLSAALTVSQLNDAVGEAGLAPFETGTVYARVRSTIGSQSSLEQFSNAISFDVFPYTTEKPRLFVVGDYQANSGYGTESADAPTLASSEFGNETNYEGYVYFGGTNINFQLHRAGASGEYVEGNPIYGDDGGTVSEGAAGAFTVSEGYYWVQVNLDEGSISLTQTEWAVAGPGSPAGDWPDPLPDADMAYDIENRIWVIDNATTSTGLFKFRANDSWGINYGVDEDNDGSLDFGGQGNDFENNINATRFVLDLSNPRAYTYSISAE